MKPEGENITQELLVRLIKGDMLAFDRVYSIYSHKLYSFIYKIVRNEDEAEDVVQEVFVKLWAARDKLNDHQLLNSYIFRIAYNRSIDLIRKRINTNKYLEQVDSTFNAQVAPSLLSEIEYNDLNNHIEKVIAELPARQKDVFLLHRKGFTYPEIAEHYGISKNTVENHMAKALKYLRQNIENSFFINLFICLFL